MVTKEKKPPASVQRARKVEQSLGVLAFQLMLAQQMVRRTKGKERKRWMKNLAQVRRQIKAQTKKSQTFWAKHTVASRSRAGRVARR